jgi:hypothetical protein
MGRRGNFFNALILLLDCTSDTLKGRTCDSHLNLSGHYTTVGSLLIPFISSPLAASSIRKARWSTRRDQSLQLCIPCEISNSLLSPSRGAEIKETTCCTCVKACGGCWGGVSITMCLRLSTSRGVEAVVGRGLYDLLHLGRLVGERGFH